MPSPAIPPDLHAADIALLLLRIVAGGFLLPHAMAKLFGWFDGPGLRGFAAELRGFGLPAAPPVPLLLASLQVAAGMLVVVGLATTLAALVAAAFLAVTVALNRTHGWFWMGGGIEYPLLWALTLVALALLGGGAYSLDALLFPHTEHTR